MTGAAFPRYQRGLEYPATVAFGLFLKARSRRRTQPAYAASFAAGENYGRLALDVTQCLHRCGRFASDP